MSIKIVQIETKVTVWKQKMLLFENLLHTVKEYISKKLKQYFSVYRKSSHRAEKEE